MDYLNKPINFSPQNQTAFCFSLVSHELPKNRKSLRDVLEVSQVENRNTTDSHFHQRAVLVIPSFSLICEILP